MIGCRLCNKTVREISSLLEIPLSTVSDIIRKWKRLGTTATQPRSGRQRKITERGQRLLRRMVRKSRSADSIAEGFRASTGINVSTKTVRLELHGMGFQSRAAACRPHITKSHAKHRMEWCKAHQHWTVEQWKHVLWSDESCFSV